MKVKKFYGSDNYEVMNKVKAELGSNAVILHQKKMKAKGVMGFFKKPMIEVVAAVEESNTSAPFEFTNHPAMVQQRLLREKVALKEGRSDIDHRHNKNGLEKEIYQIKSMLGDVVEQIERINSSDLIEKLEKIGLGNLYEIFKDNDIEDRIIDEIFKKSGFDIQSSNNVFYDEALIRDHLHCFIEEHFSHIEPKITSKVVFFVGPTGVGKTTTIAKLAASYSLEKGLDVGLISADTYRIAAVEQLKIYSDILNIPLEVIYSPQEIHRALENLRNKDVILVDTAGRSHKNKEHMEELVLLLSEIEEKDIFLTLSSTMKNKDLKEILDTYSFLRRYKIIFTKIDEVGSYGTILNIAIDQPQSLSYITTGQSVPDDIETLTKDKLLHMLLKEI